MSSDTASIRRPRRRRRFWLLLLLLPIALFLLLRWALQPERLGTLLLDRASAASGLELTVAQPASLGLWPRLQLELIALSARQPGGEQPILQAERVDIALPLALLWSDSEPEIGSVHLLRPRIQLDPLQRWRESLPTTADAQPLRLPAYAVALTIEDGSLQTADDSFEDIELQATPLRAGQPFEVHGSLIRQAGDAPPLPLQFALNLLPQHDAEGVSMTEIDLTLGPDASRDTLHLTGSAALAPTRVEFALELGLPQQWPNGWPALPELLAPRLSGRHFRLDYSGPPDFTAPLQIASLGEGDTLQASLVPQRLLAWLSASSDAPLPPVDATVTTGQLDLDGVRIEGLRIELQGDELQGDELQGDELQGDAEPANDD